MVVENRKKIILWLRWTLIIATSYVILFGTGWHGGFRWPHLLILFYILSNIILSFAREPWFWNLKAFYFIVIFDTVVVSIGMYIAQNVATDFYMVYFLIILFASMSRSFKLLIVISGFTALIYGFLLYTWGLLDSDQGINYTLRVPFIFIVSAFYGYMVLTSIKEEQRKLAISEDKYRNLFEHANDGIIILRNPEMTIADVNREVGRITQYAKQDLLKKSVIDLFAPGEKEKASTFFEKVNTQGEGRTDVFPLMRKDGAPLEVDLSVKRIDVEGESFSQVIFRDLTEQRRLEKKIQEAKRHLEAIFDGIGDQLSVQSLDYRILRVNRAVSDRYHFTFQELIGKRCYEVYCHRSEPCEKCPVAVTMKTKQFASSLIKNPEEDTTLRINAYPILDERGNIFSVIEHVQDITDERRLQEQLIQSEKLAGIGYLASGVAHEINNPLAGIIGMAEAAQEEGNILLIRNYLEDILNCSYRISEIVNGLRAYSRASRHEKQMLVDMNEVLENSLKMVLLGHKASSVEIVKKFQPVAKIEANPGEIQQVFVNLITNAFQAVNGKGGTITLSTRSLKDVIEVKVSDDGIGIPQKHVSKIFDPFFTTKRQGEGTGLGLNIVYRIVTKHGGTIDVESKEGAGATFTFRFPARRNEG